MRKLKKTPPITLEDMKKVLEKLKDKNPTMGEFLEEWGGRDFFAAVCKTLDLPLFTEMEEFKGVLDDAFQGDAAWEDLDDDWDDMGEPEDAEGKEDGDAFDEEDIPFDDDDIVSDPWGLFEALLPSTDEAVLEAIFEELLSASEDKEARIDDMVDLSELLHLIACHEYNKKTTSDNWDFPESYKEDFITAFDSIISDGYSAEPVMSLFTAFVRDLADEGNEMALHILGYHSYGGSPAFPCDWEVSRECISRLFEETGDPVYANTLGYIAYHGRCDDGVPDYEAAFKYFSYGSASGIIESTYKLADLYAGGKGIWKNEEAAFRIVSELYQDSLRRFCGGELDGKFADVALRMGRLYENGSVEEPNSHAAFYYYLQARYAIRFRRRLANDYGDDVVERNIENAITRLAPEMGQTAGKTYKRDNPWVLFMALAMDKHVLVTFKEMKNGTVKMVLDRYEADEADLHDFLITIPEYGFCSMMETVTLTTGKTKDCFIADPGEAVLITAAEYNQREGKWVFMHGNEIAASFDASWFGMKVGQKV